jgi:pyruvate dehydrogenase E2 component (dihydrolipoamide acetyltransferase)
VSVPVQSTVGFLGKAGEAIPVVTAPAPVAMKPAPAAPVRTAVSPPLPGPIAPPTAERATPTAAALLPAPVPAPSAAELFRISPRAAVLAKRCVIDPKAIKGSGPHGRVIERDVQQYLEQRGYAKLRISPAAKELAARENLDVLDLAAGDGGRITMAEVQRALAEKPTPLSKMRQIIGQRLTQSIVTQPHFYCTVSVDMTDLIAYRTQLKAAGAAYTVTDFISQAVVLSLLEFPGVNSSTDGKTTRWHSQVNLGLAVSIEGGLVVPVVRNAGQLTLAEISATAKQLAEKARAGKLRPDEMSGGTFSISNMGMLNVENFSAIINTGEGAILAVASTMKQPVVRDDQMVIRQMMKMTLSVDHRLIDGALGAQFLNAIRTKLEDLELWKRLTS